MSEPIINPVNLINMTDDTGDTAGAASVEPGFIPSDIPDTSEVSKTIGIDTINLTSSVPTFPSVPFTPVELEESPNYIQSDTPTNAPPLTVFDGFDMNSLEEVSAANEYIDPNNSAIQSLLDTLKEAGIITDGMSEDKLVLAIHNYISENYSYVAESEGDDWATVSEVIENKGGDCEDLANLEASLMMAALIDRGMSIEEAGRKVSAVVVIDKDTLLSHVYVKYTALNFDVLYLDPSNASVSRTISASQQEIFSYNDRSVDIEDHDFDYSNLATAGYTVPGSTIQYPITDYAALMKAENDLLTTARDIASSIQTFFNEVYSWKGWCGSRSQWYFLVNGHSPPPGTYFPCDMVFKSGFEAPQGGFQGLDRMADRYALYELMYLLDTSEPTQDISKLNDLMSRIAQFAADFASTAPSGVLTAASNIYNLAQDYVNVRIPAIQNCTYWTGSYMEFMVAKMSAYELEAYKLNREVLKVNMIASILSADAAVDAAQSTLNLAQANYNSAYNINVTVDNSGNSWQVPAGAWLRDWGGCLPVSYGFTTGVYWVISAALDIPDDSMTLMNLGNGWSMICGNTHGTFLNKFNTYIAPYETVVSGAQNALQQAKDNRKNIRDRFMQAYGIANNALLDVYLNNAKNTFLIAPHTGTNTSDYWKVNWEHDFFREFNPDGTDNKLGIPYRCKVVKSTLITNSLIYEARRDLRGLVQQELDNKVESQNGMDINKLFMKKTDKAQPEGPVGRIKILVIQ
ncbi:transglutaminase domain-containing protein, partial [Candidatus Margulisiibacteriota bacterium]